MLNGALRPSEHLVTFATEFTTIRVPSEPI